ncbi:heavy metal-associated isoprenylated plant protein 3-like [Setaria italica]|uniref:heavy metal-associated isoprenylated plant protein 3-like n=1 Tax=Setaria italica TaxID=4555 RepID=UPI000BE4FE7B|nr:heavy metal-associated isoprenylated plant protein 3-like [Setaria italica]
MGKEGEEQAVAANTDASGDAAAGEDNKDKESNDKDKNKGKDQDSKDKGKKPPPPLPVVTAVLKVDMHCDGCAKRIRASVHRYPGKNNQAAYLTFSLRLSLKVMRADDRCRLPGVEGVAMEVDKGSMTVVGRFDAKKLRDRVANKTRKKVDLVGNNNAGNKGGGGGGGNNKGGGGNQQKGASEEDGKPEKEHDGDKEDKVHALTYVQ